MYVVKLAYHLRASTIVPDMNTEFLYFYPHYDIASKQCSLLIHKVYSLSVTNMYHVF